MTPTTGTLLSGAEKIHELSKLLETARAERERLAREVEDVQVRFVHNIAATWDCLKIIIDFDFSVS